MSSQDFIRLEAQAFRLLEAKSPNIIMQAVECGAAEKVRQFAERHDYKVTLNEIIEVIWKEMCERLIPSDWNC